eukprot:6071412-Pyramimonas_sp.AAC.2
MEERADGQFKQRHCSDAPTCEGQGRTVARPIDAPPDVKGFNEATSVDFMPIPDLDKNMRAVLEILDVASDFTVAIYTRALDRDRQLTCRKRHLKSDGPPWLGHRGWSSRARTRPSWASSKRCITT